MAAKIDKPSATNTNSTNPSIANRSNSFFFKPVTTTDILTYIQQLNVDKSAGPEDIPIKIIKMSASVIAPVLEHLFNKCLINGVFPDSLKIGKIVPIHKKGPKMNVATIDPQHFLVHFQKFLKYAFMNKCAHILQNLNYLPQTNSDLDKTVQHRKQRVNFMMIFWKIWTRKKSLALCL